MKFLCPHCTLKLWFEFASEEEKKKFIRRHFSRECRILLVNIVKKRRGRKPRWLQVSEPKKEQVTIGKYEMPCRKKYSCYICFEKFSTNEQLEQHKESHGSEEEQEQSMESMAEQIDNYIPESKGIKSDSSDDSSDEGVETDERVSNYRCLSCNVDFKNQVDIKAHIHNQYSCKYLCKCCSRHFNTKGGFIVHALQHGITSANKFSYKCEQCPFSFDDCYQLKRHYILAHDNYADASKSKQNTKTLTKVSNKQQRTNVDSSTKQTDPSNPITGAIPIFDCDICYDVFASARALFRHKALHRKLESMPTNEKPAPVENDGKYVGNNFLTPHEPVSNFTIPSNKSSSTTPVKANTLTLTSGGVPQNASQIQNTCPPLINKSGGKISNLSLEENLVGKPLPSLKPINDMASRGPASSSKVQFIRVLNKDNSSPLMSGGFMMINPNVSANELSYQTPLASPNTNQLMTNQPKKNIAAVPSTISVNTTSAGTLILNSRSNNTPPVFTSFGGLPAVNSNQTFFVLLPSNELNQSTDDIQQTKIKYSKLKSILMSPPITSTNTSEAAAMEVKGSDSEDTEFVESKEDNFVMPIITNITTVDESDKREKPRADPASVYESEFAKFLESARKKWYTPPEFKDAIVLDDDSTSNEPSGTTRSTENIETILDKDVTSLPSSTDNDPKPKISVKKLTDLLTTPEKSEKSTDSALIIRPMEACLPCRLQFRSWLEYRRHMKDVHGKYSCSYFNCEMFDTLSEYQEHMKYFHSCKFCGKKYKSVPGHSCVAFDFPQSPDVTSDDETIIL